jgi:hypothetical protein
LNKTDADLPFQRVDPETAAALRPFLPAVVAEVIDAVQQAVPVYSGGLDPTVRTGVHAALDGFLAQIEGKDAQLPERNVYVRFGRAERRNGRSLEALLTAYRAGARSAWRALAEHGHAAGVDPQSLYALAESIFAFIDEISSASAEGHAFEESLAARELAERRRALLEALLADPPPAPEELARIAAVADWRAPERLAALAWIGDEPDRVAARMPPDALVGRVEGAMWALVPDSEAPGRRAELERALGDSGRAALGPALPPERVAESARRAGLALALVDSDGALVVADEHLLDLVLRSDLTLAGELARQALAPLAELPEGQRARLLETLAAWLDEQGEARPAAARLHVHVQTVRYRVGQLRDLLGDRLDDPQRRLELQLALRLRGAQSSTSMRAISPSRNE